MRVCDLRYDQYDGAKSESTLKDRLKTTRILTTGTLSDITCQGIRIHNFSHGFLFNWIISFGKDVFDIFHEYLTCLRVRGHSNYT